MEAIFTGARPKTSAGFALGILGVLVGISLWIIAGLRSGSESLLGTLLIGSYFSTFLPSLGLILVITGAGFCLSFSILSVTRLAQEVPPDRKATASLTEHRGTKSVGVIMTRNFRFGIAAFFQSCAVLALYSGLVDDYRSNLSMELWIRSNLPIAQYFLNSLTGLVLAAVLGLTVIQFLPGRLFAE